MLLPFFASLALAAWTPDDESCAEPRTPVSARDWQVEAPHGATHSVSLDLTEGTWMGVSVHGDTVLFSLLGDLWSVPLAGGDARRLTSGPAWETQPRFSPDGSRIAYVSDAGGNLQAWVMGADGSAPRAVTAEEEARIVDVAWDPAGPWLLVRRRTVDTRSIGVTELWQVHLDGGKGFALTSKDDHPHAAEATSDGRYVWFSSRAKRFDYDENPISGLWRIVRLDRRTGDTRTVAGGSGGASRPTLSPDGRALAFISRDRTKTLLEVLDVETGRRRVLADWLGHDQMEGFGMEDTWPAMDWVGEGEEAGIVLWADGGLWRVGLDGRRTAIPFRAKGEWTLHDVPRAAVPVPDEVTAKVLRWPRGQADGRIAFSALGVLWIRHPDGRIERVSPGTGYSPAWSPDGRSLAWTSWRDCDGCGGALHVTQGKRTEALPVRGQLVNPAWSDDGQRIVVLRGAGGQTSPDLGAEPWYEVVLLERAKKGWSGRVVTAVDNLGSNSRAPRLFLHEDRVWFTRDRPTEDRKPPETAFVSVALDGTDERVHLVLPGASEVVPSSDFSRVAWRQGFQVWVSALPRWSAEVKTADGALPARRLTEIVGDWLDWTPDGTALTWMTGNVRNTLAIDTLTPPPEDDELDPVALPVPEKLAIELRLPRARPGGTRAYVHATALTMEDDRPVVEDATIVVVGDRIASVEAGAPPPPGAEVVDLRGKTVIPGFIDVHAHLHYSAGDVLPEQEWRYLTNLDYGVTTVFDPSASTDLVFTQAERIEAGFERGPRVYSTGFVLYGALSNDAAPTPDPAAALAHVRRMKAAGATGVKVYQQSRRDQRQWYVDACKQEGLLCVAEGGGDLAMNLSMVADGMTAVEHALPMTPLWGDVRGFFSGSRTPATLGTAYTPTLLVAYGGLMGENWYYQHENPLDDPRLLRHFPRRELDARAWRLSVMARDEDWTFRETARQAARMSRAGTLVTMGAHGQLQGLGVHWELWALGGPGAMEPMEALRAATIQGARYIGLQDELGSLRAGKLADMVVLEADPRQDLRATARIALVVKNGEEWR